MRKLTYFVGVCLYLLNHTSFAQISINEGTDFYSDTAEMTCTSLLPQGSTNYHLEFIKKWAAYVSKAAFNLPYNNTEQYLDSFKSCFSSDGWSEFSEALNKSGNISLIKAKQYITTTQVVGFVAISHKEFSNIWETNTPLQITYQSNNNRVTQQLIVHLRIVKTPNNQLNVTQIVGIPRQM